MQITQQMCPAPLMPPPGRVVVGRVEITAQHASKVVSQQGVDDGSGPALVVLEGPFPRWCPGNPDVAVLPVLPPARFIGLHHRTGANPLAHHTQGRLPVGRHAPQQVADLAHREAHCMYACQPGLDDAQRRADHQAQVGHQTGNADADAALAQHLPSQVQWGLAPGTTERTPAGEDAMLRDLHRWRGRHVDHLAAARQMPPTQPPLAPRTTLQAMLDDLGRGFQAAGVVVFGRAVSAAAWDAGAHSLSRRAQEASSWLPTPQSAARQQPALL